MALASLQDIGLKPAQLRAAQRRAEQEGKSAAEYLRSLVERDLLVGESFDKVLRPVRAAFRQSGLTEDQLDTLVSSARLHLSSRPSRKAPR